MRKKATDTPIAEIENTTQTAVENITEEKDIVSQTTKEEETENTEQATKVANKGTSRGKKPTQIIETPVAVEESNNELVEVIIEEIEIHELKDKIKSNKKQKQKMSEKEKLQVKKAKAKKKEKEKNKKAKAKKKEKVKKAKAKVKAKKKAKKSKKAKARKKK